MTVVACLKWLTPHDGDDRFGGISPADACALEWALRLGEARGENVVAVTAGPVAAETALRDALACGVTRAIRIDVQDELPSADTAAALASAIDALPGDVSFICCGDYSLDRGTGSVPAFVAAQLDARQALGLVEVTIAGQTLMGLRRLDGGRRERLRVEAPAVMSVEGATVALRRAPLAGALAARSASIEVLAGPVGSHLPTARRAYRPRARILAPPAGEPLDRVKSLLSGGATTKSHGVPVELSPADAAERILAVLAEWGYSTESS